MLLGVKADSALSYRRVEEITGKIRDRLCLAPVEQFPCVHFFESTVHDWSKWTALGSVKFYFGAKSLRGSAGLTYFDQESRSIEMYLSEAEYDDFSNGKSHATFSAAHEFGHAYLHTNQLIRLANLHINEIAAFHRQTEPYPDYLDTEWQANAFAGAILMPAEGLRFLKQQRGGYLFPEDIVNTYGVSLDAAITRFRIFNGFLQ
jgi:hypothetical protein